MASGIYSPVISLLIIPCGTGSVGIGVGVGVAVGAGVGVGVSVGVGVAFFIIFSRIPVSFDSS